MKNKLFIEKSKKIHYNKYDYSEINYISAKEKIKIYCNICKCFFYQTPNNHLSGYGCPFCGKTKKRTQENFINLSKKIHKNKYDYSKVDYKNNLKKIKIICVTHGEFEQIPKNHLKGQGCPKCAKNKILTTKEYIEKCKKVHNNFFNYQKVNYINSQTKILIVCPIHGEFKQKAGNHLYKKYGCPICKESKGEKNISTILNNKNIKYIRQYKFYGCKNKLQLPFDFYLPEYNICIEYDGKQHFVPVEIFGGINNFKQTINNDKIKTEYCKENNIQLIRIKYNEKIGEKINKIL